MLKIYNTLTRKIEEFKAISLPQVGLYTCGPTVYNYAHIGNLRTYIFEDILVRVLEMNGYQVKRVMNITDVGHLTADRDMGEDKIEKESKKEGKSAWDIANFYTNAFKNDMDRLNLLPPDLWVKATDHIQEQIDLIKKLEEKGYTYRTSDGIYFDTSKFSDYGKMATVDLKQLQEGARVERNPEKKNPTDFALWKFSPKDSKRQMEWDSPWGVGFPGWHIECSAMSMKYLGATFDIHTGGVDHINVHHTNEIAQSEAVTGKQFANYWLHGEFLLIDAGRMGKSEGNFITLDDVVKKGYDPLSYRYFVLGAHYRQKLNFIWESLQQAQNGLNNLYSMVRNLLTNRGDREVLSDEKLQKIDMFRQQFEDALNSDLNTPEALAIMWNMLKSNIPSGDKYELLLHFDSVLGLKLDKVTLQKEGPIPREILELVQKREQLRKEKKWDEADRVRQEIEAKGYKVEDSTTGSKLTKIK